MAAGAMEAAGVCFGTAADSGAGFTVGAAGTLAGVFAGCRFCGSFAGGFAVVLGAGAADGCFSCGGLGAGVTGGFSASFAGSLSCTGASGVVVSKIAAAGNAMGGSGAKSACLDCCLMPSTPIETITAAIMSIPVSSSACKTSAGDTPFFALLALRVPFLRTGCLRGSPGLLGLRLAV